MSTAIGVSLPRLATAVGKAVSEYAVLNKTPGFTADFIKNKYPGKANFASAITHARSGNAVMTDGYGPELVTNGGFDSDSDWTDESASGASASIVDGIAVLSGNNSRLVQDITTEIGKTYFVDALSSGSQGTRRITAKDGSTTLLTIDFDDGETSGAFTATSTTTEITLYGYGSGLGKFDHVSVREMPVLKWAPHNRIPNSNGFGSWTESAEVDLTINNATAPDGTQTASTLSSTTDATNRGINFLQQWTDGQTNFAIFVRRASSGISSILIGQNNLAERSTHTISDDWQLITNTRASGSDRLVIHFPSGSNGESIEIWGAHLYRSDLGGMVDNPDRGDSYVPTTSSAKYLPRVGHHVYNGSAWVNEGLLAESESRTNLERYSDILNSQWSKSATTITEDSAVSPAGLEDATLVKETSATANHRITGGFVPTVGTTYTFSVFVKKKERTIFSVGGAGLYAANELPEFDVDNGIAYNGGTGNADVNIQDVGNGWFRCSVTFTATGTSAFIIQLHDVLVNGAPPSSSGKSYTGDGTSGMYFWGAQAEATSSPPSSLIPTSGSTVTRAAETFTIPSANLPWPEPQYIGDELVDNGDFSDTSDWSLQSGVSIGSGVLSTDGTTTGELARQSNIGITSGNLYAISLDVTSLTAGKFGVKLGGTTPVYFDTTGSHEAYIIATATDNVQIMGLSGTTGSVDNISVREIDPLSVSIAMDGRMTYADVDGYSTVIHQRWLEDGNNLFISRVDTAGAQVGHLIAQQNESGVADYAIGDPSNTAYSPGILVPFDIAMRHGSTFIQVMGEARGGTVNTTPTALPDLSSTDLQLAYKFMGTVGTFRVWDRDITDDGLVEATNPSLEPSLSLTFEGVGANSFVVNNWSE